MQLTTPWHRFRTWLAGKSPRRVDKLRRPRRLSFDRLEDRSMLAFAPELVRDINLVTGINPDSGPSNLVIVGATTYFSASNSQNGNELWKTDGTSAGPSWSAISARAQAGPTLGI